MAVTPLPAHIFAHKSRGGKVVINVSGLKLAGTAGALAHAPVTG